MLAILSYTLLFTGAQSFSQSNSLAVKLSRACAFYSTNNVFDKTNKAGKIITSFLDYSQTNITLLVRTRQPSPHEYSNAISNTNLFSLPEQKLLTEALRKFPNGGSFRNRSGDGYDVALQSGNRILFQQIKSGRLNGLRIVLCSEQCLSWMRFADDKAVGTWLEWDAAGNLKLEAEFKQPYDFFGHLILFR